MLKCISDKVAEYSPPLNEKVSRRASVLVPLFQRDGEVHVLLTKRSEEMNSHSGQVSFPGGKEDPEDGGFIGAALRETHEEVGIAPAEVEVIGRLDQIISRNYYLVTPVVGLIPDNYEAIANPEANPDEIHSIFDVPLSFFLDPKNHQADEFSRAGLTHYSHHFQYGDYDVWGLTALLILRLIEVGTGVEIPFDVHHPKSKVNWMEMSQQYQGERLWDDD